MHSLSLSACHVEPRLPILLRLTLVLSQSQPPPLSHLFEAVTSTATNEHTLTRSPPVSFMRTLSPARFLPLLCVRSHFLPSYLFHVRALISPLPISVVLTLSCVSLPPLPCSFSSPTPRPHEYSLSLSLFLPSSLFPHPIPLFYLSLRSSIPMPFSVRPSKYITTASTTQQLVCYNS